ncbi:MAG: DUF6851 domain-containing protein [Pseudomonadota bacterium]
MEDDDVQLMVDPATQLVTVNDPSPTVSVLWDQAAQAAVIETAPGPTIASRAYAITHTAIFDAWAQFDEDAVATSIGDDLQIGPDLNTDALKSIAMSQAALTVLTDLFQDSGVDFIATFEAAAGFDPRLADFAEGAPELLALDIGTQVGNAVIAARADDGSNQANGYEDTTGYTPVNASPLEITEIDKWTPESVPIDPVDSDPEQSFLTPHWGNVTTFGIPSGDAMRPEAPEPFFLPGVNATLDLDAATITVVEGDNATVLPVTSDLVGTVINPAFVAQAEEVVAFSANLTDEQKLIAEFWEDGGGTSFPPGVWMSFGQFVSGRADHDIDTDATLFFLLSNAMMDAAIATWEAKVFYDYARPVRAIRDLGSLGLIGEEGTDAITGETGFVVDAWAGPGLGTDTILAENFLTYQTPGTDPSPPFAEYTSGHSAFSAAGAEVLALFTSSDAFGASVTFEPGSSRFEPGITPAQPVTLEWETFSEAGDEGGISRLYGGIHFDDGDINGRNLGAEVGEAAFKAAFAFVSAASDAPDDPGLQGATDVARFYEAFFGRVTDFAGLNFWSDQSEAGFDDVSLISAFLAAPEFAQSGSTPGESEAVLDLMFENLAIDKDSTDLDETLLGRISDGESFATVALDLINSDEATDATTYLGALEDDGAGSIWFA